MRLDLSQINVIGDLCTNHKQNWDSFCSLFEEITSAGAVPKIQLFNEQTFPRDWAKSLVEGTFIASVFRPDDVKFIRPFKPLALKIASVESTYDKLIDACTSTGLPLLISTGGMSEDEFIKLAERLEFYGDQVCLMHCTSEYPTAPKHLQLERLNEMNSILDDLESEASTGLSLHYPGAGKLAIAGAAVALGATQFEVHVLHDDQARNTGDELCAITPMHLCALVNNVRVAAIAMGDRDRWTVPDREQVLEWRKRWQTP